MKAIIAGGGIGGLTTALCLHARGIACEVYEQAEVLKELGVGITLMPHGVRQLAQLGLLDALDACAVRSAHLTFMTHRGQPVWDEPRGLLAGHDVPQFFIHACCRGCSTARSVTGFRRIRSGSAGVSRASGRTAPP